jgi:hypothetical protein
MSSATDTMADRHGRMLARLGELSLSLAEAVHAQALSAETPEDQARLAQAFNRAARGVRQAIALEAKLERDRQADARAEVAQAAAAADAARQKTREQVRLTVGRALVGEAHGFDRENLLRELDHLLDEGELFDDFAEAPYAAQIEMLCGYLGLSAEEAETLSPFRPGAPPPPPPRGPRESPWDLARFDDAPVHRDVEAGGWRGSG